MMLPKKLQSKIEKRTKENALRTLGLSHTLIDFSSNDYLGFSTSKSIYNNASEILKKHQLEINGATGSRLLTGNDDLYIETEKYIANFHNTEDALIFNSGYDANIGFFSCVPQRGDIILYDELCHASIRDGITMSHATSYKFQHNNLKNLEQLIHKQKVQSQKATIYIVTESIFSMDGDQPDVITLTTICKENQCYLIIDEAHALGVFGKQGEGLAQEIGIEKDIFARIVTFGKALGCHGAAIVGSAQLKQYLINFSRSFIYTTALPPHSIATIKAAYTELKENKAITDKLKSNIAILHKYILKKGITTYFTLNQSAIHTCIIGGNIQTKQISVLLQKKGFNVKPILSPTVPKGQERLRICLHSFNTEKEITNLIDYIVKYLTHIIH